MLEFPTPHSNKKITQNAYFFKIQNMIVYISYELFWRFESKLQKKQVKSFKIAIFVQKKRQNLKKCKNIQDNIIFFPPEYKRQNNSY